MIRCKDLKEFLNENIPDDIILLEINEQNLSDEAVARIKTKLWDILDKAIDKHYRGDK